MSVLIKLALVILLGSVAAWLVIFALILLTLWWVNKDE